MKRIFEPLPLVAAGLLGGLFLLIMVRITGSYVDEQKPDPVLLVAGAGIATGLLVQIGVRIIGVS